MTTTQINVRYSAVDGASKRRTFKTLTGARKFAQHHVGNHPEIGSGYAVAGDGIGKVTVEGATLADLFPSEPVETAAKANGASEPTAPEPQSWLDATRYVETLGDLFKQDPAGFKPEDREQLVIMLKDTAKKLVRKGHNGGGGKGIAPWIRERFKAGATQEQVAAELPERFPGTGAARNPKGYARHYQTH